MPKLCRTQTGMSLLRSSSLLFGTVALAIAAGCVEEPPPRAATTPAPPPSVTAKATATADEVEPPHPPPLPAQLADLGTGTATFSTVPGPDPKRPMVERIVAGDPIYARVTVPHSLRTSTTAVTFAVVAEWKRPDGRLQTCRSPIDGTSKSGARALVSTSFEVSIFALPGAPEADVVLHCEEWIRSEATTGALGMASLRLHLTASYEGRWTDVVDARVQLDGTDRTATAQRLARIDLAAQAEEKRQIALRRVPASLMPMLDGLAMISVKEKIQDEKITEFTPLRVVMTERDFTIERDEKTSVVLRRNIAGIVAFKKPDGTCFLEDAYFIQEFDGVGYGRLAADFPTTPSGPGILCANAGP